MAFSSIQLPRNTALPRVLCVYFGLLMLFTRRYLLTSWSKAAGALYKNPADMTLRWRRCLKGRSMLRFVQNYRCWINSVFVSKCSAMWLHFIQLEFHRLLIIASFFFQKTTSISLVVTKLFFILECLRVKQHSNFHKVNVSEISLSSLFPSRMLILWRHWYETLQSIYYLLESKVVMLCMKFSLTWRCVEGDVSFQAPWHFFSRNISVQIVSLQSLSQSLHWLISSHLGFFICL